MDQLLRLLQIVLILAGCLMICFGLISAAIAVPALINQANASEVVVFFAYLALAPAGVAVMLLAKRLSQL